MFAQSIMAINNKTTTIMKKKSISDKAFLVLLFGTIILAILSSCSIDQCTEVMCVEGTSSSLEVTYGEVEFDCGNFNIGDYYRLNDIRYRIVSCN
mgnify:CR=1 FL=1